MPFGGRSVCHTGGHSLKCVWRRWDIDPTGLAPWKWSSVVSSQRTPSRQHNTSYILCQLKPPNSNEYAPQSVFTKVVFEKLVLPTSWTVGDQQDNSDSAYGARKAEAWSHTLYNVVEAGSSRSGPQQKEVHYCTACWWCTLVNGWRALQHYATEWAEIQSGSGSSLLSTWCCVWLTLPALTPNGLAWWLYLVYSFLSTFSLSLSLTNFDRFLADTECKFYWTGMRELSDDTIHNH